MSIHQQTQAKYIFESKYNSDLNNIQEDPYVVLITGAAGNIGYTISFMIGQGRMFGHNRKIILRLFDIPSRLNDLKGLNLELEDCGFSIIKDINYTTNEEEAFLGIDFAIMCGSKPRIQGMKRHNLLKENSKIFEEQGKIINRVAKKSLKVLDIVK
jgi:malate dehydrogenase